MPKYKGRNKPYTVRGIARLKCRCGRQAVHQWQACANGRRFSVVCLECDYALNKAALELIYGDTAWTRQRLKGYRKELGL